MSSPTSIDAREALRLGIIPVLVAAYAVGTGFPLPFFPPALAATILAVSAVRPPLVLLVLLLAVMTGITFVLATLFTAIASHPVPFWMVVLAASAIAFRRLARDPADMAGSVGLTMIAMTTVVLQLSMMPPDRLVSTVGHALLIAVAAALVGHAVLPSAPRPAAAMPAPAMRPGDGLRTLGRAAGLTGILVLMLKVEEKNALLVAVTVGPVLALTDRRAAWSFGRRALHANLLAFLAAMPPLLLLLLRPDGLVALLLAMATGCLLARRAIGGGPASAAAVAMPLYGVVLGLFATTAATAGEAALGDRMLTRLGAIATAVALGVAVQALLPAPRRGATASAAR